jgi:hypothetical protein
MVMTINAKTGNVLWTDMSMDQKNLYSSAIDSFSSQKNVDIILIY